MRHTSQRAFTLVEILTIVAVVGVLAGLVVVGFGSWQRSQATTVVKSDVKQAVSGLASYKNFKNNYPPNLAGTGFAASKDVALKLSTNAPSVGVYQGLSGDQNAQLFLNTCNANLFTTPNNTACKFHVSFKVMVVEQKSTSKGQADRTLFGIVPSSSQILRLAAAVSRLPVIKR